MEEPVVKGIEKKERKEIRINWVRHFLRFLLGLLAFQFGVMWAPQQHEPAWFLWGLLLTVYAIIEVITSPLDQA